MRSTSFELVSDFQREILHNRSPAQVRLPIDKDFAENCLAEELSEFATALDAGDVVGTVDALADLVYFALGISYQMGVNFDEVFQLVHTANMQKRRGLTKRGIAGNDAAKPDGWVDPKDGIRRLLYGTP